MEPKKPNEMRRLVTSIRQFYMELQISNANLAFTCRHPGLPGSSDVLQFALHIAQETFAPNDSIEESTE